MAEIRVEKKSSMSWVWWILGLIVIGLIIWALVAAGEDEPEVGAVEPLEEPVAVTEPAVVDQGADFGTQGTAGAGIPVSEILANPDAWDGRQVSGEVQVAEVVSDRGFWIEGDAQRMFVLIDEAQADVHEVNAGQRLMLTDAEVRSPEQASAITGTLDSQAQQIVQQQAAVLVIDTLDLEILEVPTS